MTDSLKDIVARALAAHMGVVMPVCPPSNPSPVDPAICKEDG